MALRVFLVLLLSTAVGCAGPMHGVRGDHHGPRGGYHHHHGGGDGFFALLDGLVTVTEIAADVAYISEVSRPAQQPSFVVKNRPAPPPSETVRALPPWFQGRLVPSSWTRASLLELRIGLKSNAAGATSYVAIFDSDELGRFSFAAPSAGSYTLVVLSPDYAGELRFATDGKTTFPIELPVVPRSMPLAMPPAP